MRALVLAMTACGSASTPAIQAVPPTTAAPTEAIAAKPDPCVAWVAREIEGMTWYIGEYGLLDYVDVERLPGVLAAQCQNLTEAEIACSSQDGCLDDSKRTTMRAALLPLLELPADLRARAKTAKTCAYGDAIAAMQRCAAMPARFRKQLEKAYYSTANVQSPPFWCHVGSEVMKQRLAAIGC